jgi:exonuclease SbcD
VAARPFVTIEVAVPPEASDPTQVVTEAIGRKHIAGAVARLRISIPEELLPRLDDAAVREALSAAHIAAPITREVLRERRPRLGAAAQGISPQEALHWYLDNRTSLAPETRRQAQEQGTELIQAELSGE